jgi:hypothetical protein
MKTLVSFLALVSVLTISYISQAQELLPYSDVNLALEMPNGEHAMANDGSVYVIYTEEQNEQLQKIHKNYKSLASYNIQLWELYLDLSNYCDKEYSVLKVENEKLNYKLSEANKTNNELKLSLDQSKEKKFMRVMGVSLLVGLGMGALGVGIGSAL